MVGYHVGEVVGRHQLRVLVFRQRLGLVFGGIAAAAGQRYFRLDGAVGVVIVHSLEQVDERLHVHLLFLGHGLGEQ